jgi:hypothetical protein
MDSSYNWAALIGHQPIRNAILLGLIMFFKENDATAI